MNIGKLLNGVKNITEVYEGVKNKMFKRDYVEQIADHRWQICKECEHLDTQGSGCAAPGTQPCCADCGCSLGFKTRALSSSCPKDKWPSLMSDDEEKALFEEIQRKEKELEAKNNTDKFKGI
tara:strand:+ start:502 stop:867 length:366 start_codon:yes stop_codon:yes gene_type:complete